MSYKEYSASFLSYHLSIRILGLEDASISS